MLLPQSSMETVAGVMANLKYEDQSLALLRKAISSERQFVAN